MKMISRDAVTVVLVAVALAAMVYALLTANWLVAALGAFFAGSVLFSRRIEKRLH